MNRYKPTNELYRQTRKNRISPNLKTLSSGQFIKKIDVFDHRFARVAALRSCMLAAAMTFLVSAGCVAYHPKPLDDARLAKALASPNRDQLVRGAAVLGHPRLPPLKLDFSKPLTDRELGVIAVLANPELKALRLREKVAEAQVFEAGLLPDPEITASLDHPVSGAGAVEGFKAGTDWLVTALITRPADERVARTSARQVHRDVAWQEWLVANQARLLTRRVICLERRWAVAEEAERNEKLLLEALHHSLEKHDCNEETVGTYLTVYMNAHQRTLLLSREAESARQELNRVLGLPPGEQLRLDTDIATARTPGNPDFLFESAEHDRLDLLALRTGYESQETKLYRAVLGQYPRFRLGLNTARDTEGVHTYGISISLDLPLFNRNRGAIAIEEATRERLYQEYISRLHQMRADIAALATQLIRIEQERTTLYEQQRELEQIEKRIATALQRGEATLLNYANARAALLEQRLRLLELDQAAAEREVALDLAVGTAWAH
jgi:cobalt-zinc-cadmium efflux system outer membrane protein